MRLRLPVFVWALALVACGFEAPAPQRTPPPATPPPPLSSISATLKVSGDDIVAMLNERTKSQLAKLEGGEVNCLIQKCQLDLVATRTGAITGHATGSGMQLLLPFALHAHLDFDSKLFKTGGDASAQGEALALTQLALKPDWRIESHTKGDVRLSDAKLKIGPLKMSVAELWNSNQEHLSAPIFKAIDKRIASAFKLRGQVEHLWRKLQQPIRIGKAPDSWLVLSPERLRVTPLKTENGSLVISLAADVRAHAVVGSRPEVPAGSAKMPATQALEAPSNTFSASVPVILSYADAARLAMAQLKKKPLRAGGLNLRLDEVQILPSRDDLVVHAQFCFGKSWDFTHLLDSCGDVFLRGAPRFDGHTGKIQVTNLHYDVGSENLMLRIVHALAGDTLAKLIEPHLVFDESREIAKLKSEVAASLAKPQGKGIALTGHIEKFGDPALTWTKDGFVALFSAKGTVSASLSLNGGAK
jgi:hypothetical protein